ncbi:MAG: phosphoglycolate phosphatase [Proteobacteria bacterium]|nr:phosphoglycolate phosphatase [Pseudomonadota bacterium]
MIKAIAFDLDGTLMDSIPDLAAAANAARAEQGLPLLPSEQMESYVGDGVEIMVSRAIANDKAAVYTGTAAQKQALATFDAHYRANLTANTRFYDGVEPVLRALKQRGIPMALVTNKAERYTHPLMAELGAAELFDIMVCGDTLAEKKPSAAPLLHVCEKLGIAPAELLMIGDSVNDALTARNAGCPVYLVPHGYADPHSIDADRVLRDTAELLDLV